MPIPGTPLSDSAPITPFESAPFDCVFQICTSEKRDPYLRGEGDRTPAAPSMIFLAGADGFMIGNYLTTTGLDPADDLKMIRDMELQI